jgi:serine/threonine protein kinase
VAERLAPGVGERFGGYTIESLLGRGGMGAVYLALHERLGRKVALKVIAPELALDEGFRARFLRESQLAASLDHPNVIPIYDADEVDGVLYLAMRYVSGPSLQALLRERGSLSPAETLRIAEQIGGALDAAHAAELIHRDLKPANILLTEAERHAYLCDFGLAKRTSSRGMTHAGSFLGTVDYCSPEQIRGEPLDGRADVYSFGCVLYHCLSGEPPYARESEVAVLQAHLNEPPPSLSPELDGVFARAMPKERDDRYPTAGALASDLRAAIVGEAPATAAAATPRPPRVETTQVIPRRRRRRWVWIAAVVALLALAAGAAAVWAMRGSSSGKSASDLRPFVDRIENMLTQSAAGRREISRAIDQGLRCKISNAEAARRIDSVADNRQSILQQLGSLTATTPETDRMVTLLQQGLQHSIEADRHYRDGFLGTPKCPLPRNPSFDLALASDRRATTAKELFVARFDPLAMSLRERAWTAGEF